MSDYIIKLIDIHGNTVSNLICQDTPIIGVVVDIYNDMIENGYDKQDLDNCRIYIVEIEDGGDIQDILDPKPEGS